MRLTTEQIARITIEATTGRPDSLNTEESRAFRAAVEKDIAAIRAAGGYVAIPNEIPDFD
jgi:biotin operon repressor